MQVSLSLSRSATLCNVAGVMSARNLAWKRHLSPRRIATRDTEKLVTVEVHAGFYTGWKRQFTADTVLLPPPTVFTRRNFFPHREIHRAR